MNIRVWKDSAIDWFRSGHATDEQWEEMAEALLNRSENEGLNNVLDGSIFNHACYKDTTSHKFSK